MTTTFDVSHEKYLRTTAWHLPLPFGASAARMLRATCRPSPAPVFLVDENGKRRKMLRTSEVIAWLRTIMPDAVTPEAEAALIRQSAIFHPSKIIA